MATRRWLLRKAYREVKERRGKLNSALHEATAVRAFKLPLTLGGAAEAAACFRRALGVARLAEHLALDVGVVGLQQDARDAVDRVVVGLPLLRVEVVDVPRLRDAIRRGSDDEAYYSDEDDEADESGGGSCTTLEA